MADRGRHAPAASDYGKRNRELRQWRQPAGRWWPPPSVGSPTGVEALIAEGANRYAPKQKRQRFIEARGEAGEVAAHLERLRRYRFITEAQLLTGLTLADRICAMLTGLIKRHS